MSGTVLNSWKEIATYMGRGVRTVQRWESDLGLPVRRPRGKRRSAVVAMSDDLDRWLKNLPEQKLLSNEEHSAEHMQIQALKSDVETSVRIINEQCARLQDCVNRTLDLCEKILAQSADMETPQRPAAEANFRHQRPASSSR